MTKQEKFNNWCKVALIFLIAVLWWILYYKDWCCCCSKSATHSTVATQTCKPSGKIKVIDIPPDYIGLFPVEPVQYHYDDLLLPRYNSDFEGWYYYPVFEDSRKPEHVDAPTLFDLFRGE